MVETGQAPKRPAPGVGAQARESRATLEDLIGLLLDRPETLREASPEVQNWDSLFDKATSHGLEALLYRAALGSGIRAPDPVRKRIERRIAFSDLGQERLVAALDGALASLNRAGIRAVALKGPVLAERLYGDPLLRRSVDLDLLVAERDLDTAVNTLQGAGFCPESHGAEVYFRQHHHHIHLRRGTLPLELHFRLFTGFGATVTSEDFVSRAFQYQTKNGSPTWILRPEDEFFYLCVHCCQHRFRSLNWLYELAVFLERHHRLNWVEVSRLADSWHLRRVLAFTLEELCRRMGVKAPVDLPKRQSEVQANFARRILMSTNHRDPHSVLSILGKHAFQALLCDRSRAAAGFLGHQFLRVLRRRAYRYVPSAVPEEWSA